MTTLEKHLLILDPLLEELAPLGYFRKGKQLWHINRREGYAILIEAEMYMRGTYKNILVQYGSFWKDVSASSRGVSLGSILVLDDRCIPFDTLFFDTAEELEKIIRDSAPIFVDMMKKTRLPILQSIGDLSSFVQASQSLDALSTGISWPGGERVWDYLALGDRKRAFEYLRTQSQYTWRPIFEQSIASLPHDQQEERRRDHAQYNARLDRLEAQNRSKLQSVLIDLAKLSDDELAAIMQERFARSEASLAAYLGPRRWNQL